MALLDQTISINFGQGVDTKTSNKLVMPGKMLRLENAVFTKAKRINKRNGYISMADGTIGTSKTAVAASVTTQGLLFTARKTGSTGNSISVAFTSGAVAGSEVVTVTWPTISIQVAAGVSTTAQVVTAVTNSIGTLLVTASVVTPGTIATGGGAVSLTGGVDGATVSTTTLTAPQMVKEYNGELIAVDAGRMYSYSSTEEAWVDKGGASTVAVGALPVSQSQFIQADPSAARIGNLQIMSWSNGGAVTATIWDMSTNTALTPDTVIFGTSAVGVTARQCMSIALGSTSLGVVYSDTANIYLVIATVTPTSVTFGAPVTIASDSTDPGYFHIVNLSTGAAIAYSGTGSTLKLKTINTAGTVVDSASIASTSVNSVVSVKVASDGKIWVYWATTSAILYAVFTSALAAVLAKTTIFSSLIPCVTLAAREVSTTSQTLAFSLGPVSATHYVTYQISANTSGTIGAPSFMAWDASVYSSFFQMGGKDYILLKSSGLVSQSTYFLLDAADNSVVAKAFSGAANSSLIVGEVSPAIVTGSKVCIPVGVVVNGLSLINYLDAVGTKLLNLDFAHPELNQSVPLASLVSNGGIIKAYDGNRNAELGYNLFPSIVAVAGTSGSGTLPNGDYSVVAVYEWVDANGNLHQSAPSIASTVTVSAGGTGIITLTINNLSLTDKQYPLANPRISIYTTLADGTVFYRQSSTTAGLINIFNNPIGGTQSLILTHEPAATNGLLYTEGQVIENIAPPPSLTLAAHNNRLFLVDSTDLNTLWYCKSISPGTGISFSDLLTVQVNSIGGPINALASMDEKLVMIETKQPFIMAGDGANDTGTGVSFSFPQPIPSDVGCTSSKSVLVSPLGVHFKSANGYYLLDRSTSVRYWGAEIEGYNDQRVTSALLIPGTTTMRFLTDDGLTLVYDYLVGQWSTFTNFEGLSATIWNNLYVYAREDGQIFLEDPTSFLDGEESYQVKAQTAWLKGATVQGLERIKHILQLGTYANGDSALHGLNVSAGYNYEADDVIPDFTDPVPYYFSESVDASGSFQNLYSLTIQKCEAVSFLFEEIVTGEAGENFSLSDLTLQVGVKKGTFKVPAGQSTG